MTPFWASPAQLTYLWAPLWTIFNQMAGADVVMLAKSLCLLLPAVGDHRFFFCFSPAFPIFSAAHDTPSRTNCKQRAKKADGIELRSEPSKLHHMEIKLATAVILWVLRCEKVAKNGSKKAHLQSCVQRSSRWHFTAISLPFHLSPMRQTLR